MTKILIPEAALSQHIAVLGKTGSGKSTGIKSALVEPALERGRRVCIVDPTGAWWGLRSSADGKGPGFPVLVLGGDHGDLPLPHLGGAAVAQLVVDGVNLVADTTLLTVGERTRWFIDFAAGIYRMNRAPLHLILDECHNFAPKGRIPDPDVGKMLHATTTLASGGRSRGVRLVMITQRPQKLHNDALTSADTLMAFRVLAPHDRGAVKDWIDGAADDQRGREVLDSLAGLKRGEGWVWYPEGAHLERVKFPLGRTFDSSATPEEGKELQRPKAVADLDLTAIRAAMAEAVQEAEENDPKLLKKKVADLERQLATKGPNGHAIDEAGLAAIRSRSDADGYARGYHCAAIAFEPEVAHAQHELESLGVRLDGLRRTLTEAIRKGAPPSPAAVLEHFKVPAAPRPPAGQAKSAPKRESGAPRPPAALDPSNPLSKADRLILAALAQFPAGRNKTQVAILTGYAKGAGHFNNTLGALRSRAFIEGGGENLRATPAGLDALGPYDPLPTGRALLDHWLGQLGKAERSILEVAAHAYPSGLSKDDVGNRTGYAPSAGHFNNALGRLRTLELIVGKGTIRASDNLF